MAADETHGVADPHAPTTPTPRSEARVEGLFTDELSGWAALEALNVFDRDELLTAAAVGLTQVGWRNTELEAVHSGWVARHADDLARDRAALLTLRGVADGAELPRLGALVRQIGRGQGIPDDVMLRANVGTCLEVRETLSTTVIGAGEHELDPDSESDMADSAAGLPAWFEAVYGLFQDPTRQMRVGGGRVSAEQLLGPSWDRYFDDVDRKMSTVMHVIDLAGSRRALWLLALSGVTYSDDWFPSHLWPKAVGELHDRVRAGRLDEVSWGTAAFQPVPCPIPDDVAFWETLTTAPHLLNGAQARWVVTSRVGELLRSERQRQRAARGADLAAPRFCGLSGLF